MAPRIGAGGRVSARRLRALVVAHHRKSRAERVIGVEPRLATRLAPHGRVEGAIEDGPGPISGWGDQNPKGQPQAHSRSALVAPMLANPSTPLRSGARSCSFATTPSRCKARRNETFRNQSWGRLPLPLPRLTHASEIAWTNAPDCSWRRSASPGFPGCHMTEPSGRCAPGSTPGRASATSLSAWPTQGLRPAAHALRRARLAGHVLHDRDGALADERDRYQLGAHAVARGPVDSVGGYSEPYRRTA